MSTVAVEVDTAYRLLAPSRSSLQRGSRRSPVERMAEVELTRCRIDQLLDSMSCAELGYPARRRPGRRTARTLPLLPPPQ